MKIDRDRIRATADLFSSRLDTAWAKIEARDSIIFDMRQLIQVQENALTWHKANEAELNRYIAVVESDARKWRRTAEWMKIGGLIGVGALAAVFLVSW